VSFAAAPSRRGLQRRLDFLHNSEVPMSQNAGSTERLLENEEYKRLHEQHHEYENRLSQFSDKVVLSDEEQVEETTLKKKKLQLKDRMEAIARKMREDH
jgi:uncharacterized protein YdcH (DUF465 family)